MKRLVLAACLVIAAVGAGIAAPRMDIEDPAVLDVIETRTGGFPAVVGGAGPSNRALAASSAAYRAMAEMITRDVGELRAEMAANGRKLYEVTDDNIGRVIDTRWLTSPVARYRLAGVVNRLDRQDFADGPGCGELRFIYRLSYDFTDARTRRHHASRLPFNFNVVFSVPEDVGGGCAESARGWTAALAGPAGELAERLLKGPLSPERRRLKQVELNAQIVRFPSGMETEFGGQAAYLMRIFTLRDGAVVAKPLENTPDVARIAADRDLRSGMIADIRAHLDAIDRGTWRMPERYLATKAISYSTYGSIRSANHPFETLLRGVEFEPDRFAGRRLIATRAGLIERLDNQTCMGCHQSNATAGFHIIGLDDARASPINRVKTGVSPHFHAERARRAAYLTAVAEGREPDRFRPLSSAPPAVWGEGARYREASAGMPCLPDGERGKIAGAWVCAAGLACKAIATAPGQEIAFGQCLVREEKQMFSGHPCVEGTIQPGRFPYLDRFRIGARFAAPAAEMNFASYNCRPPKIGVPAGAAYRKCTQADKEFAGFRGGKVPAEICGFAGGKAFDDCVASNNFAACLGSVIVRGNRPTCGRDLFCREDYMCQAIPDDVPGATAPEVRDFGYCSPTYFLFQMRIDGHPDPAGKI